MTTLAALTTIVLKYPAAKLAGRDLHLRGSATGLSWDAGVKMMPAGTDTWTLSLNATAGEFKALIADSVWAVGSNAAISGGTQPYTPWFDSGGGRYEYVRNVPSSAFQNTRDLVVYVPPSFDENPYAAYADVILAQDGENFFNDSTAFGGRSWRALPTLDAEIGSGRMREAIVVAADNTASRIDEYTYIADPQYGGGRAREYLAFLLETVLPLASQRYRLTADVRVSVLGSSLGGLLACYAAWTSPRVAAAACMSPSMWWDNQDFLHHLMATAPPTPRPVVYLDSGDTDGGDSEIWPDTIAVRDKMEVLGWTLGEDLYHYVDQGGCHSESYWGARLALPLRALLPGSGAVASGAQSAS